MNNSFLRRFVGRALVMVSSKTKLLCVAANRGNKQDKKIWLFLWEIGVFFVLLCFVSVRKEYRIHPWATLEKKKNLSPNFGKFLCRVAKKNTMTPVFKRKQSTQKICQKSHLHMSKKSDTKTLSKSNLFVYTRLKISHYFFLLFLFLCMFLFKLSSSLRILRKAPRGRRQPVSLARTVKGSSTCTYRWSTARKTHSETSLTKVSTRTRKRFGDCFGRLLTVWHTSIHR